MKKIILLISVYLIYANCPAQTNTFPSSGNVGIGTNDPQEKLDVVGSLRLGGDTGILMNSDLDVSDLNPGTTYLAASIKGRKWGHIVMDIYGNDSKDAFAVRTDSNRDGILDNIPFLVNNAGNVGIGTTNPDSKLTVKGKIHAQEVKVDLNGSVAPDYVFKEGYGLKTLEEVEAHIKENGHLPNIPSAKQMEAEGVLLKEMNLKLLEKVEELTLYTIQQNGQINSQDKLIKNQQQLIESLLERVSKLERSDRKVKINN